MKKAVTLSALAVVAVTAATTELGKSAVSFPLKMVRDLLAPSAPEAAPTLGNEVRVVIPPGMSVGEVYVTRPVTGTHVEIKRQIYKIEPK